MQFSRSKDQIIIDQLDPFAFEMLMLIPVSSNPEGIPEAEDRLFSSPETVSSEFSEDWKSYVEPELRHLFQSAVEVVESDLQAMDHAMSESGGSTPELHIPSKHIEAWVSALNQARLVISAKFGFNREEMERGLPESIQSPRQMGLLQMDLYDFLLLCFVQEME